MSYTYRIICNDCKAVLAKLRSYNVPSIPALIDDNGGNCPECGKKLETGLPLINRDDKK